MFITFRDTLRKISPPWLQGGRVGKVMYAIGLQFDGLTDLATDAVKNRFPGIWLNEGLAYSGRERRIRRGRNEAAATYAERLVGWLDAHRRRGGPFALLEQLYGFWRSNPFPIELLYVHGTRFRLESDGTITWSSSPFDIVKSAQWARWWLFYDWPHTIGPDGVWDDPGTWDDGGVWDSDLSPEDVEDVRLVPEDWNAGHTLGTVVLVQPGIELWDYPEGEWDEPGGTWGDDDQLVVALEVR
jgi:hypothetical protein